MHRNSGNALAGHLEESVVWLPSHATLILALRRRLTWENYSAQFVCGCRLACSNLLEVGGPVWIET